MAVNLLKADIDFDSNLNYAGFVDRAISTPYNVPSSLMTAIVPSSDTRSTLTYRDTTGLAFLIFPRPEIEHMVWV
jgi:hypothetical protein